MSLGVRLDANSYDKSMSNMLNQISPRISSSYQLNEKLFFENQMKEIEASNEMNSLKNSMNKLLVMQKMQEYHIAL